MILQHNQLQNGCPKIPQQRTGYSTSYYYYAHKKTKTSIVFPLFIDGSTSVTEAACQHLAIEVSKLKTEPIQL